MRHHHSQDFRADQRFGSAAFAETEELRRAGCFQNGGIYVGEIEGRALRFSSDASWLTVAGAGSGKLRDVISYTACLEPGSDAAITPMLALDPRGEIAAISHSILAPHAIEGLYWNPTALCGLPQHSCNPLDILSSDSDCLIPDTQFICEGLIPLTGGNGQYFELRAREWLSAIVVALVERDGGVSFPSLKDQLTVIEGDPGAWADFLEGMMGSPLGFVRQTAHEMLTKQQDAEREFGSIMGEIYGHTAFLNDPSLRRHLTGSDLSLRDLTDSSRTVRIHLNVPAEYLGIWSPLLRVFFTAAMLYKTRRPEARRILLFVDEAGQLGHFEALMRAFSFGRGAGVKSWAFYQDFGQIIRHFGNEGLQGFMGSGQLRQFFGVRSYETARMISEMLGSETIEYEDNLATSEARRRRQSSAQSVFMGGDPFAAAFDAAHFARAEQHRVKQIRPLMTPDEILSLPEDKQILFVSGMNLKPILADKRPYFCSRAMAGRYLANPYHPPKTSVQVMGRFGPRKARVIEGPVPKKYEHFPQYSNGRALWVEGYNF